MLAVTEEVAAEARELRTVGYLHCPPRHPKIYATKVFTRFLRSAVRFCYDLSLRFTVEDRFPLLTYRLYFPGCRLMTVQ